MVGNAFGEALLIWSFMVYRGPGKNWAFFLVYWIKLLFCITFLKINLTNMKKRTTLIALCLSMLAFTCSMAFASPPPLKMKSETVMKPCSVQPDFISLQYDATPVDQAVIYVNVSPCTFTEVNNNLIDKGSAQVSARFKPISSSGTTTTTFKDAINVNLPSYYWTSHYTASRNLTDHPPTRSTATNILKKPGIDKHINSGPEIPGSV